MTKNKALICIITTIIIMIGVFLSSLSYIEMKQKSFEDNYIAAFKGKDNYKIYSTYIYEKNNSKNKKEYKYINTEVSINQYESTTSEEVVTKKGTAKSKKILFDIANKNKANSYVLSPKESKVYTIEEFKEKFLV